MGAFGSEATDNDLQFPERLIECGMGDIFNLRNARKRAERQRAERTASPIDCCTDAAKPSANSKPNARSKPAATSIATGSKRETSDEISGRQTVHRHCRPQDQR